MSCAPPASTSPEDRQRGGRSGLREGLPWKHHSQEPRGAQGNQQNVASEEDQVQEAWPGPTDEPHITDLFLDPVGEVGGAGVDAREAVPAAAKAPVQHPHLNPGVVHLADKGTARITLWRGGREA